jgi:hypothetical protein
MLKRLFGRGGATPTPGKVKKVSPLSTAEFRAASPDEPTEKVLRGSISDHVHRTSSQQPPHVQDYLRRQMYFDMRHRCGGRGRCMVGANVCSYPRCFTWRPAIKGGDVLSEKGQIEEAIEAMSGDSLPKSLRDIIAESKTDENLDAVAAKISGEIDVLYERAAKEMMAAAGTDSVARDAAGAPRVSDDLSGKIIVLAVWRAVVLVNARKDEAAVDSLLAVLPRLPKEHRGAVYSAAAGWACLHDMEVRFFRVHLAEFPELRAELPVPDIDKQADTLLERVVAACEGEPYFVEHCAHEVFSKEISAIIARAQNAQESGDSVEDPMGTPFVMLSLVAYKNRIGGTFWDLLMRLAMMPPL